MSTEREMIEAQRRVFEGPGYEKHLIGPVELGLLFDAARKLRTHTTQLDNERLVRLNNDLTDAIRARSEEFSRMRNRIVELEAEVARLRSGNGGQT